MSEQNDKMKFIDEYVCDALNLGGGRTPDELYDDAAAEWEGSKTDAAYESQRDREMSEPMTPGTRIKVRCHYYKCSSESILDELIHKAVGRVSDFSGFDTKSGKRVLGWSCKDEAEATELRKRLASCPEVTVT